MRLSVVVLACVLVLGSFTANAEWFDRFRPTMETQGGHDDDHHDHYDCPPCPDCPVCETCPPCPDIIPCEESLPCAQLYCPPPEACAPALDCGCDCPAPSPCPYTPAPDVVCPPPDACPPAPDRDCPAPEPCPGPTIITPICPAPEACPGTGPCDCPAPEPCGYAPAPDCQCPAPLSCPCAPSPADKYCPAPEPCVRCVPEYSSSSSSSTAETGGVSTGTTGGGGGVSTGTTGGGGGGGTTQSYSVTSQDTSFFLLNGAQNLAITASVGTVLTFNVNAPGHPFWIQTTPGIGMVNVFNNGVTGNGAQVGTVTLTITSSTPSTLYYQCQFHTPMVGTITVV